ncbi:MAG: hypothetical protein WCY34_04595 [Candidatus Omnitrophota bacterium]|jgi:hypothetical protein
MKRKIILGIVIISFLSGCNFFNREKPAIEIGDIKVSVESFNRAYKASSMSSHLYSKEDFLDAFIPRKLILKQAEKMNLDKDPEFLQDIQLFWEQSLLKLIVAKKLNSLSADIKVNNDEIEEYYEKQKDAEFEEKSLDEVRGQIKWVIFKAKQNQALKDWIDSLRDNTDIKIDYSRLGMKNN